MASESEQMVVRSEFERSIALRVFAIECGEEDGDEVE